MSWSWAHVPGPRLSIFLLRGHMKYPTPTHYPVQLLEESNVENLVSPCIPFPSIFFSQPHLSRGGLYNPVPCSFSLQFTSCLQSIGVSLLQLWGKWLHASTEQLRKLKPRLAKRLARVTHGKSAPSGSRTSRPAFSCRAPASGPIHTVCGGLHDMSAHIML